MGSITHGYQTKNKVYVMFVNNIYVYDNNFDRLNYPTELSMIKEQYPMINELNEVTSIVNKYPFIYIGYSKASSTIKAIKEAKQSIYKKWRKKERIWSPWMKMYCEIEDSNSLKISIHELEVVDETLVDATVDKWIIEYSNKYPRCVVNKHNSPEPVEVEVLFKDVGIQCDLIKMPVSERQYKIGQEESQRRWREKNKFRLREYAKNYYWKNKKIENPE